MPWRDPARWSLLAAVLILGMFLLEVAIVIALIVR